MNVGRTISHYEITEELGRGGMGVVYKAHDKKLNRTVALKFLPQHLTLDDEATARFLREARAAAAIEHPNICSIHEISETDDGQTFIVMGYYGGETMRAVLESGEWRMEKGSAGEIVDIAIQILEGLSAAHRAGIVHRDIKPSNIVVADDGRVRILDFGLAKLEGGVDITKEDVTSGTAAYMSPEQISGAEVDHRTDLWSVGVVLYEMIAGKRPFEGEYDQAISYAIVNKEPAPLQDLAADVPPALRAAIDRALKKDPDERFQSAEEFVKALAPLSAQAAVSGTFLDSAKKPKVLIPLAVVVILLALFGWRWYEDYSRVRWAREEALPRLQSLAEQVTWGSQAVELWHGYALAREVGEIIPDDPTFNRLWEELSIAVPILTDPPGAVATISPYDDPSVRIELGVTPLDSVRVPRVASRLRLELDDFRPIQDLYHWLHRRVRGPGYTYGFYRLQADSLADLGAEEVFVSGWTGQPFLVGVDHIEERPVPDFIIDRFEVTNRQFKVFVDSGGYDKLELWGHPFIDDAREISWSDAMRRFVDQTGQPGPSTWTLGDYAEGEGRHPVAGVSWYEAAAYAQFVGKELPNIYQWSMAAVPYVSGLIIPTSNIEDGTGTMPVGAADAMSGFGTQDMAGNVREWVFNATADPGRHFILGGGWNDRPYAFNDGYAQPAFDRSPTNGFRLVRYLPSEFNQDSLREAIELPFRDYRTEEPVSDEVFESFVRLYDYDRTDLDASIDEIVEEDDYIRQRISFGASYGDERMEALFFIPRDVEPPYQTAVFFPGDGGFYTDSSNEVVPSPWLIKAGRAVLVPILKGIYERRSILETSIPRATVQYRDHVIMWSKDVRRSVDYLQSRTDVDADALFFVGVSWGGRMAPVMLALEDRFKMAILYVAGLRFQETLREADPWNFLPHVTLPVLMLNGEYDFYFPVETSQRPFFEHLGTPADRKEWLVYPGGHSVPPVELAKESLAWMNRWLGRP